MRRLFVALRGVDNTRLDVFLLSSRGWKAGRTAACEPPGTLTFWHMRLVCETDASNTRIYEFDFHACASVKLSRYREIFKMRNAYARSAFGEENFGGRRGGEETEQRIYLGRRRNWIGFHRISSLSPARSTRYSTETRRRGLTQVPGSEKS